MRIAVTGASGFVGANLIPFLLARGHVVVAVSRNREKVKIHPWFSQVEFLALDVLKPLDQPFNLLGRPDVVIHLAWPDLPNYSSTFHFEETLPASYHFLRELVMGGLHHLMVVGTCFEYGMKNGELSESLPTEPDNAYALAKDTLRKFLQFLQQNYPFRMQWARLFYMYGTGQSPKSLLAQLEQAINNGESSFNMSGGDQLRDYLPVERVCDRLTKLIEHPSHEGIVNVCNGKPTKVRDLVEDYLEKKGAKLNLNLGYYPYPVHEPMEFWGDSTLQNKTIGPL